MIDVEFDFTSDSPGYWDEFWENNDGLGEGGSDPDSAGVALQRYNQELWSKELPNGEKMELTLDENGSLSWNGFRFGSDSIITSFRYRGRGLCWSRWPSRWMIIGDLWRISCIKLTRLVGKLFFRSTRGVLIKRVE